MSEQTAVQWLALRYHHRQGYLKQEDIAEAKQMEKEQIIESVDFALSRKGIASIGAQIVASLEDGSAGEHYYNYKYGKK